MSLGEGEEEMILWWRDDNLRGVDDFVAEIALTRRARQRHLADASSSLCGLQFTHPRWPAQRDSNEYLVVETCACALPIGHGGGCVCGHNIERHVYGVDADGREHRALVMRWLRTIPRAVRGLQGD